jgi:hypothetical protein
MSAVPCREPAAERPSTETPPAVLVGVVPVTREPPDLAGTLLRYRDALATAGHAVRFVAVLDGPQPRALEALRQLRRQGQALEILSLPHPVGEAGALAVGLASAGGEIVLTLPAEAQIEPAELPRLVAALEGCDMALAARGDGSFGREGKLDWLVRLLFGSPFKDVRTGVRAMRGEVAAELNPYGNQHRFLPLLAQAQGFTVREIVARPAVPPPTSRRKPLGLDWSVLLDVLTVYFLLRFIKKPFRFFGGFGFALLAAGGLITLWLVAVRLFWGVPLADRPALVLSTLMVVLGLQIISVGLIGEIITFAYARELKDYKVERLVE